MVTGVCINLLVGGFFIYFYMASVKNTPFRKNVVQYLEYMIQDLGSPADFQRAGEISKNVSLEIRYEGPEGEWTTSKELPPVEDMQLEKFTESPGVFIGKAQSKSFLVFTDGNNRYTFDLIKSYEQQRFAWLKITVLIIFLSLLLVCVYFIIRKILKPIRQLNEAVQQISDGNLDHQVPVNKSDELGSLSDAFNSMTLRIKEMINARDQLLLNVSHELRSPITRMKVAMEFLPDTTAKKNLTEDIAEMETMVSEILETERLRSEHGRLNLQPTVLADIMQEVVDYFAESYPDISFENKAHHAPLNLDRQLIKTVFNNILDNAVKHSKKTGTPIRVSLTQKDSYSVVHIRDTGEGIPAEDLANIFEPFYRADKSRDRKTGGYGLGLSLCKTIMEAHNGKIEIDSQAGRGTVVQLFFPGK